MTIKEFLLISSTTFIFYVSLWSIWAFFALSIDLPYLSLPTWSGSLIYLPHAARVLCVVYFGYKCVPALYLAEISGPQFLFPETYNVDVFLPALGAALSVPLAISLLSLVGLNLGISRSSPLYKGSYKHIGLIVILSAAINAMLVNAALSFQAGNFFAATQANPMQVCRFFIGDILGAATVITILATMLLPILRQTKEPLR
mgnify:CR=1 FL=1